MIKKDRDDMDINLQTKNVVYQTKTEEKKEH